MYANRDDKMAMACCLDNCLRIGDDAKIVNPRTSIQCKVQAGYPCAQLLRQVCVQTWRQGCRSSSQDDHYAEMPCKPDAKDAEAVPRMTMMQRGR